MKRKKQKEEIKSDNGRATVGGGFNRRTPPPAEAFFGRAKSSFSISFFSFFLAVAKTIRKEGRKRKSITASLFLLFALGCWAGGGSPQGRRQTE